ncbi:MAG: hypothetical protein JKY52_09570 [Flavobacteriales bacterium]|nr:hypothetical protein [Flavobacteriales bacterium]
MKIELVKFKTGDYGVRGRKHRFQPWEYYEAATYHGYTSDRGIAYNCQFNLGRAKILLGEIKELRKKYDINPVEVIG